MSLTQKKQYLITSDRTRSPLLRFIKRRGRMARASLNTFPWAPGNSLLNSSHDRTKIIKSRIFHPFRRYALLCNTNPCKCKVIFIIILIFLCGCLLQTNPQKHQIVTSTSRLLIGSTIIFKNSNIAVGRFAEPVQSR